MFAKTMPRVREPQGVSKVTPEEMTIAVATAYVEHQAQQYERMGLGPAAIHRVKDNALDRFNSWLAEIRGTPLKKDEMP